MQQQCVSTNFKTAYKTLYFELIEIYLKIGYHSVK